MWVTTLMLIIIHITGLYIHPTGEITGDMGRLGMGQLGIPQRTSSWPATAAATDIIKVYEGLVFPNYVVAYRKKHL